MTTLAFVTLVVAALAIALLWLRAHDRRLAIAERPPTTPTRRSTASSATQGDERSKPLEWKAAPPMPAPRSGEHAEDTLRARIRDRYIEARFPGVARGARDLQNPDRIIKCARLYFEEERADRALELLQLALRVVPDCEALALAQLEIAFLARDARSFVRYAHAFRDAWPLSPEWGKVARLGYGLVPEEPLFADRAPAPANASYGPWPDMPNWIQASWDLTSEVVAGDFHRAMAADTRSRETRALNKVA